MSSYSASKNDYGRKTKGRHSSHGEEISSKNYTGDKYSSISEISINENLSKENNIETDSHIQLIKYANRQSQSENNIHKCKKRNSSYIYNFLNYKNRGCRVNVIIQGIGIISGEVVLNFEGILALKHENTIVFINSTFISGFY